MHKETNSQSLFEFDKSFNKTIIGTDEAGRGPGAGGVFASAVFFEKVTPKLIEELSILNDSKQLSPKKREYLYDFVKNESINKTVCIEVEEIEKTRGINIINNFEKLLTKVSLIGGFFAAILAVLPTLVNNYTPLKGIQFGGTSVLILIGVGMDFSKQLDSQLVMRHYQGFLK